MSTRSKRRQSTRSLRSQVPSVTSREGSHGPRFDAAMMICAIVLGLLALAAYSNSFQADLVTDSAVLVKQDPRVREVSAENISNIFSHGYWWPSFVSDLYRPVTTLSFLFNYSTLGNRDHPEGYHVLNLLLHWLNSVLVLLIVRRLAGGVGLAMVAAALFAVHPVNTEAVTYIAGRADLLAALSVLLGGWCYLQWTTATGARGAAWLVGLAANAFWGVFAKENAVMIVAFIFLYDWLWRWPSVTGPTLSSRAKQAARQSSPAYLAVAPAVLALGFARWQSSIGSSVFAQIFVDNPIIGADSWWQAKMTAIKVLGLDLVLFLYPATLSNDYSYSQIPLFGGPSSTWENVVAWISLAAIGALIALAIRLRRRLPLFAWAVGFLLLMLLPTSNLVITIGSIMAERFLYLPSIGFCVAAALGLWRALGQQRVAVVASAVVVLALGARTYARNIDWQSEHSLWASTLAASPNSFKAYKGSATATWANGIGTGERELDAAIAFAESGVAILERTPLPVAYRDGALYADLGQYYRLKGEAFAVRGKEEDARPFFQKSAATLVKAREVDIADAGNANIYVQLGAVYLDLHQWAEAEGAARHAMRLQPLDHSGYRLAGMARFNQGQLEDAAALFAAITLFQPRNADAWSALSATFDRLSIQPPPIVQTGSGAMLDERSPTGRRLINKGAAIVLQQLLDARQLEAAHAYQQDFITRLHVPASEMPFVPSGR